MVSLFLMCAEQEIVDGERIEVENCLEVLAVTFRGFNDHVRLNALREQCSYIENHEDVRSSKRGKGRKTALVETVVVADPERATMLATLMVSGTVIIGVAALVAIRRQRHYELLTPI